MHEWMNNKRKVIISTHERNDFKRGRHSENIQASKSSQTAL
jgi:hypothetical protein